ncbi:hypothetical protein ACTFIY_011390 [Dictyostelium cf. discoideum]
MNVNKIIDFSNKFRKEFPYEELGKINWFPGHMIKNRRLLVDTLKFIDIVMEVRDSRAPISTENPMLSELLKESSKKKTTKFIVLNKNDLSNKHLQSKIKQYFEKQPPHQQQQSQLQQPQPQQQQFVEFTQSILTESPQALSIKLNKANPKHPFQLVKKAVEIHHKLNPPKYKNYLTTQLMRPLNVLICGLPNVGKSSFINSVRNASKIGNSKSAKVGALPGVTRHISGFVACEDPPIFIVDTPGIMIPGNLDSNETTLTLALLGCITEKIVPIISLSDFLLFKLNSISNFNYLKLIENENIKEEENENNNNNNNNNDNIIPTNLDKFSNEPTDDINKFLKLLSKRNKMLLPGGLPDLELAAKYFIAQYREGKLGCFTLDKIQFQPINSKQVKKDEKQEVKKDEKKKVKNEKKKSD